LSGRSVLIIGSGRPVLITGRSRLTSDSNQQV